MSHLEQRLEHDLGEIRERIAAMAADVEQALDNAFAALQSADERLAFATILSDHPINRAMRNIDRLCHAFIAVHLPSAGHLRLLSSVIRANIMLERIGDYAVTIARESVQMNAVPKGMMARELQRISSEVRLVLREAVSAFNDLNAERARSTITLAEQVEYNMDGIYAELLDNTEPGERRNAMIAMILFSQLKRVADQAKNLAEETIFAVTGETKAPKIYRILFIDQDGAGLAPMAAAIATRLFPEAGRYRSAGACPAAILDADMMAYMRERGVDLCDPLPNPLDTRREFLAGFQVIVGLNLSVRDTLGNIPFRTSALRWKIPDFSREEGRSAWDSRYKEVAFRIRELMILLRGEETLGHG